MGPNRSMTQSRCPWLHFTTLDSGGRPNETASLAAPRLQGGHSRTAAGWLDPIRGRSRPSVVAYGATSVVVTVQPQLARAFRSRSAVEVALQMASPPKLCVFTPFTEQSHSVTSWPAMFVRRQSMS